MERMLALKGIGYVSKEYEERTTYGFAFTPAMREQQMFIQLLQEESVLEDAGIQFRTSLTLDFLRGKEVYCFVFFHEYDKIDHKLLLYRFIVDIVDIITISAPDKYRNHACKAAIYAMLSRVHLTMHAYPEAGNYADSSLQLWHTLINYNTVKTDATLPFAAVNDENLYNARVPNKQFQMLLPVIGAAYIDTLLLAQYDKADLRKTIFFTQEARPRRRGFYDGMAATIYTGLAVDEMYLNYAESLARQGDKTAALQWLNQLLLQRYATGLLPPATADTAEEALAVILNERRKELVMRGLRWLDLRRLNQEKYGIVITRIMNGNKYQLMPGSSLYTLPIPDDALEGTNMTQNER